MKHPLENVGRQFEDLQKNYHMFDWRQDGPFILVATNSVPMMAKPVKFRVALQHSNGFIATMTRPCVVKSDLKISACGAFSELLQRLADLAVSLRHVRSLVHSEKEYNE